LSYFTSHIFVMYVFKISSCKLFASAGFEMWSSWSLPPELLGLQWATGAWWEGFFMEKLYRPVAEGHIKDCKDLLLLFYGNSLIHVFLFSHFMTYFLTWPL
jgi:hypothetical protein